MEIGVRTSGKTEFIDITSKVEAAVRSSGKREGLCTVHSLHTTAALMINEFEPNILADYEQFLSRLVPPANYAHNAVDDNADAHLKSALLGSTRAIPVEGGKLMLGTWQRIIFCEFDGPRERRVAVFIR